MADEPKGESPYETLFFFVGGLTVLIILWFARGGPQHADLRGIFLNPPAPLGNGGAYGPQVQVGSSTIHNP